jgi:diguanylate cyclase (GGDEF)-like protein
MRRTVAELAIEHLDSPVQSVVTVSLGVSTVIPIPGCIPADLIQAADQGLYQAKQEGRDRWIRTDCIPLSCKSPWN